MKILKFYYFAVDTGVILTNLNPLNFEKKV